MRWVGVGVEQTLNVVWVSRWSEVGLGDPVSFFGSFVVMIL